MDGQAIVLSGSKPVDFSPKSGIKKNEINPPSGKKLGVSLQESAALLFVVSSLADTAGSLFEAFRTQPITPTSLILTPGVILIIIGGGTGLGALSLFLAGHIRGDGSETPTLPASAQQQSRCPLTKEDLTKFLKYGAAYSCSVGGLLDTVGTLLEIHKQPGVIPLIGQLGKGFLITSTVFNAAGLVFVLSEGAVWLNNSRLASPKCTDLTVANNEPDATLEEESIVPSDSATPIEDGASFSKWDVIETLKLVGATLFSAGSFFDSLGSLTTNFSGNNSTQISGNNSTQTDNTTGYTVLTLAGAANAIGLFVYVTAHVMEKYYSRSPKSVDSSTPLLSGTSRKNESDSVVDLSDADQSQNGKRTLLSGTSTENENGSGSAVDLIEADQSPNAT